MKCEQAEAFMAAMLAGEIAGADRRSLEEHLLDCAGCRGGFVLAQAGWKAEWPDRPAPSLPALPVETPRALQFLRPATAAAAALCVALLFVASAREPRKAAPPPVVSAPPAILASMQEAGIGVMEARDEEGRPAGELGLASHTVSVEILDGVAKTTVEENFRNVSDRRLEGTFHFPLPPDASISRLALEVNGKIEEGTCLERERARQVFEQIVRKMQDPALLEWMPGGIFKCRVFPIEPRSTKRVILAYTQALPYFRGRMSYVYPLASEKTRTHPPDEVRIDVRARFSGRLAKLASPSHLVDVVRRDTHEARASFSARAYRPTNDFVVNLEFEDDEIRVVPHKADGDDGYFALFLTPRGGPERRPGRYCFILDISATVSGPELDVARRLVAAMIDRAIPGDRFEVIAHNVYSESSGEVDARGAVAFMDRLRPMGASDVLAALRAAPAEAEIVYIGEGTPTIGETEPARILEAVKGRRIRAVGVGSDANAGLLSKLGGYFSISPNDSVGLRVNEIAQTLGNEVLSGIRVEGGDALYDVVGARDIYFGERLAVTGRYRGAAARLVVAASGGYRREVEVSFPAKEEGNNFVRRLWAQRKVADLLAQGGKEREVTDLGVRHQIMTPYTSFLVLESEQMWKDYQLKREVQKQDEVLGRQKVDQQRELELLFGQAVMYFERDEFGKCAEACDKMLAISPKLTTAAEMKSVAERRNHLAVGRDAGSRQLVEGWRKSFAEAGRGDALERIVRNAEESAERLKSITMKLEEGKGTIGKLLVDGNAKSSDDVFRAVVATETPPAPTPKPVAEAPKPQPSSVDKVLGSAVDSAEASSKAARMDHDLQRQLDFANTSLSKLEAGQQVFVRQLEVQLAQIREMEAMIGEALNGKSTAVADVQYARQRAEELEKRLADLEGRRVIEMKRGDFHGHRVELVSPSGGGAGGPLTGARFVSDYPDFLKNIGVEGDALADLRELHRNVDRFVFNVEPERIAVLVDGDALAGDEKRMTEVGGEKRALEEKLNHLSQLGIRTEAAPDEVAHRKEVVRAMGILLERAYAAFDQKRFDRAPKAADEILLIDPHYTVAKELREDALKTRHKEDYYRIVAEKVEHWKRLTDTDKEAVIPYSATVRFPSREEWSMVSRRIVPWPRIEAGLEEDPDILAIRRKLETMRIDMTFENAKLEDILTHIRDLSGLNIIFDAQMRDRVEFEKRITVKLKQALLKDAMAQVLEPFDLVVVITAEKVVLLTSAERGRAHGRPSVTAASNGDVAIGMGTAAGLAAGQLVAIEREGRFVALVRILAAAESESRGAVWRGLSAGRIQPGDEVKIVADLGRYLAGLPREIRLELASKAAIGTIRAKMAVRE